MSEAVSCRRGEALQESLPFSALLCSHPPFTGICMAVALRIFSHRAGWPQAVCNLCDKGDATREPNR